MQDSTAIKITAIAAITVLEAIALLVLHINGVILTTVIAVIAGLAGYSLKGLALRKSEAEVNDEA